MDADRHLLSRTLRLSDATVRPSSHCRCRQTISCRICEAILYVTELTSLRLFYSMSINFILGNLVRKFQVRHFEVLPFRCHYFAAVHLKSTCYWISDVYLEPKTEIVLLNKIVDYIWRKPACVYSSHQCLSIGGFGEFGECRRKFGLCTRSVKTPLL